MLPLRFAAVCPAAHTHTLQLVFPNGSVVMMWRGGDHWYDIHLAHARNWSWAPYNSSLSGSVFTNIDTRQHGVEVS